MKLKRDVRIAIVIPAYNEGLVVREVVTATKAVFAKGKYPVDIVVVDDGSKDNTASEAKAGGAIVINHILNSGVGAATATGLSYAYQNGYSTAVTMDADGQHKPEDVLAGIKQQEKTATDLLIGSRLIDKRGMSKVKILGNKGLSFITFTLFGINVTDSQSGLRVFSKQALESLRWKTSGYEFCSEMLWRAKQTNLSVGEYPITAVYTDYSKAKGQNNWNGVNILKSLIRQRIVEMFE